MAAAPPLETSALDEAKERLRTAIAEIRVHAESLSGAEAVEMGKFLVDQQRALGLATAGTTATIAEDFNTGVFEDSPRPKSRRGKSFFRDATEFVAMMCTLTKAEAARLISRGRHFVTEKLSPSFARIADQLDPVALDAAIRTRGKIETALNNAGVSDVDKHLSAIEKQLAERALQTTPAEFMRLADRRAAAVQDELTSPSKELTDAQRNAAEGLRYIGPVGKTHYKYEMVVDQEGHEQLQSLESEIRGPKNKEHRFDSRTTAQKVLDAVLAAIRHEVLTEHRKTFRRKPLYTVIVNAETLLPRLRAGQNPTNPRVVPRPEGQFSGEWQLRDLRRAACEAEILPIVFDGKSQPIDVGRKERTFSEYQYRALAARDRGCVVPGCTFPPEWCEAHHIVSWLDGGETSVDNGALLCKHHHDALHVGAFAMKLQDGVVWCALPESVDPAGTWRRNLIHRD